ncbi:MAG: hypothetical protein LBU24_05455 [Methanocalculaceae archaeon]|jgi:hypothetical protein|nr:hypothetical protein [Methanocalculaceae archaeon]
MSNVPSLLMGLSGLGRGGAIEMTEGNLPVFGKYCGSALVTTADNAGVTRLMYEIEVCKEVTEAVACEWFDAFPKAHNLALSTAITEIFPMYPPFWRLTGTDKDRHTKTTHHEKSSDGEYLLLVNTCQQEISASSLRQRRREHICRMWTAAFLFLRRPVT